MPYDTGVLKEQAFKAIEEHNLYFVEDVIAYLPCAKPTFYEHFPNQSDTKKEIDSALEANRINTKVKMRKKWSDSDNATLQIALMKVICTDEEAHRLNGTKTEQKITADEETIKRLKVEFVNGKK